MVKSDPRINPITIMIGRRSLRSSPSSEKNLKDKAKTANEHGTEIKCACRSAKSSDHSGNSLKAGDLNNLVDAQKRSNPIGLTPNVANLSISGFAKNTTAAANAALARRRFEKAKRREKMQLPIQPAIVAIHKLKPYWAGIFVNFKRIENM